MNKNKIIFLRIIKIVLNEDKINVNNKGMVRFVNLKNEFRIKKADIFQSLINVYIIVFL